MTQDINRVIVPLDASSETSTAIDTASRLAARWRVPLHGVFVEDEELIGLAGLPFARQVTLGVGPEPLTKEQVEDHFRAFAERARRELAEAADRYAVKWSFETVRGPLALDTIGGEHDLSLPVRRRAQSAIISASPRAAGRGWRLLCGLSFWRSARGTPVDRSLPCYTGAARNRRGRWTSLRRSPASTAAA